MELLGVLCGDRDCEIGAGPRAGARLGAARRSMLYSPARIPPIRVRKGTRPNPMQLATKTRKSVLGTIWTSALAACFAAAGCSVDLSKLRPNHGTARFPSWTPGEHRRCRHGFADKRSHEATPRRQGISPYAPTRAQTARSRKPGKTSHRIRTSAGRRTMPYSWRISTTSTLREMAALRRTGPPSSKWAAGRSRRH
jgi:hypothetical protein